MSDGFQPLVGVVVYTSTDVDAADFFSSETNLEELNASARNHIYFSVPSSVANGEFDDVYDEIDLGRRCPNISRRNLPCVSVDDAAGAHTIVSLVGLDAGGIQRRLRLLVDAATRERTAGGLQRELERLMSDDQPQTGTAHEAAPARPFPPWAQRAGFGVGAATLLFFMVLVFVANAGGLHPATRVPIACVLALGVSLAVAFIGGDAVANGSLPLPVAEGNAMKFSVTGGIGAFVIVFVLAASLFPTGATAAPPPPVTLTHQIENPRRISAEEALRRLWKGHSPRYAVRLVPLEETALDPTLGRESVTYVQVADYAEVAGLTLADACMKLGLEPSSCTVTVFGVEDFGHKLMIRPGSFRGALKLAEDEGIFDPTQLAEPFRSQFAKGGRDNRGLEDWALGGGRAALENAYLTLRDTTNFASRVSELDDDWTGLGYTRSRKGESLRLPDLLPAAAIELLGEELPFGARSFFVRNVRRADIPTSVTWWMPDPHATLPMQPFMDPTADDR
jgi:hypothetical protein